MITILILQMLFYAYRATGVIILTVILWGWCNCPPPFFRRNWGPELGSGPSRMAEPVDGGASIHTPVWPQSLYFPNHIMLPLND